MCIAEAVGKGCANRREDVKIVQILLNMSGAQPLLAVDGAYGGNTGAGIEGFQTSIGQQQPTGRVAAGDETIQRLKEHVPANWGREALQAIMPGAPDARIEKFLGPLKSGMEASGIATPLQQAHFLAQIAHESGELIYVGNSQRQRL